MYNVKQWWTVYLDLSCVMIIVARCNCSTSIRFWQLFLRCWMIQIPQSESLLFHWLWKCLKTRFLLIFVPLFVGLCPCLYRCYICVCCFQKDAMENSVEIVIEKLLNVTKDIVPKVMNGSNPLLVCVLYMSPIYPCPKSLSYWVKTLEWFIFLSLLNTTFH